MFHSIRHKARREARFIRRFAKFLLRSRNAKPEKEMTIPDAIETWIERRPHNLALIDGERQLTYRQMDEHANRVARWAEGVGVGHGDVVALLMTNRLEYVCTWLGILKVGGVCAFINCHLRGNPLAHTIRTSGAKHVIVGGELAESWGSARELLEYPPQTWTENAPGDDVTIEDAKSLNEVLDVMSGAPLPKDIRKGLTCDKSAVYIYTSGTTGLPKAANITHIRGLSMMNGFACLLGSVESDRVYIPLPLYHATGGMGGIGAALTVGGTAVIRDKFSAGEFWSDVVRHRCTMFIYVGELCRYLVNRPEHPDERRHSVRACLGNGLRPEVWPEFRDRFRLPHIVEFYGSSEGNVSFFNLDDKVGAVGRLPPYMELVIKVKVVEFDVEREEIVRGPDGFCIECPAGTAGEVIGLIDETKPGGRFDGYADPEATKKKILTDAFEKGDAWFRTGDLLKRDEDGYFYFVDRIGDTFRWKGENVATSEVAEVLGVLPSIAEANVYGVTIPGTDGRAGMASIVVAGELDLAAVYAHLAKDLAPYARPLFLRRCETIEVTGTFKHRKTDLVAEGFDPSKIDEPLFFRDDAAETYVTLTPELHEQIINGELRI